MSPASHTHVRLFALHGGGQIGKNSTRSSFPVHVERTSRCLLSNQQEAIRSQPAASQRLQAGVKD